MVCLKTVGWITNWRLWVDAKLCFVWSGSTLFAKACLNKYGSSVMLEIKSVHSIHGPRQEKKMPLNICKMIRFRLSCACAKYHPGLCCPFIDAVLSGDSVSGQWRPWSDCADVSAYAWRHVFTWHGPHNLLLRFLISEFFRFITLWWAKQNLASVNFILTRSHNDKEDNIWHCSCHSAALNLWKIISTGDLNSGKCLGFQQWNNVVRLFCKRKYYGGWVVNTPNFEVPGLNPTTGVILKLSERKKFCNNFRFSGRSLVQIFDFPIHSIHFHLSLSSRQREVSQLRETFSPKSYPALKLIFSSWLYSTLLHSLSLSPLCCLSMT